MGASRAASKSEPRKATKEAHPAVAPAAAANDAAVEWRWSGQLDALDQYELVTARRCGRYMMWPAGLPARDVARWFGHRVEPELLGLGPFSWETTSVHPVVEAAARKLVLVNRSGICIAFDDVPSLFGVDLTADTLAVAGRKLVDVKVASIEVAHSDAPSTAPMLRTFGERWTNGDLHRDFPDYVKKIESAQDNVERLAYVYNTTLGPPYATVGDVPLDRFTEDHGLAVMRALPKRLSRATRRHVARALMRVMRLGVFPARIIKVNPLPPGFVPSPGKQQAGAWWTPDDDAKLASCVDVPLLLRLFYAFTFREGLRETEAADLTWDDFDFRHGAGRVSLNENKTDDPRTWALYRGTKDALETWRTVLEAAGLPAKGKAFVFVHPDGRHKGKRLYVKRLAEMFRGHVMRAEVWRPEFEKAPNRMQLRFHELRAGFVSWALATGKNESWVMDRTGHQDSTMLYRYKRRARTQAELLISEPLPLLDVLPELRDAAAADHLKKADPLRPQAEVAEWQTQRIQNPPSERA